MKTRGGANIARLCPDREHWRIIGGGTGALADLALQISKRERIEILAPSSAVVLERFSLPKAPREDLQSMAQLQLEKLLPYAAEEFVFDFWEGESGEDSVEVLAIAVSLPALEECCAPFRESNQGPSAVGVYACQLAGNLEGKQGRGLVVWGELGRVFLALVEGGRLHWLEGLPEVDAAGADTEISRALLGAELAGAGTDVQWAVVSGLPGWVAAVQCALSGVSVQEMILEPADRPAGNWLPPGWAMEESNRLRRSALIERLQWIGLAYLGAVTLGFAWLAFQKSKLNRLSAELAQLQPKVELANSRQNQWHQVEPAVEPSRYLVEILHQLQKAVGPADIRITEFLMTPRDFTVAGEAASATEAIDYMTRIEKEPELSAFRIQRENPKILANERAQFRMSAKAESQVPGPKR